MPEPGSALRPLPEQGAAPAVTAEQAGETGQAGQGRHSGTHPHPDGEQAPYAAGPHEDADQSRTLHTEVAQLRRAMQTRPTIDQACGVLIATFGLSAQAAWSVLVTTSQNTNIKLHRLADQLVGTAQGEQLPAGVRKQLAAAVAKANAASKSPGSAS